MLFQRMISTHLRVAYNGQTETKGRCNFLFNRDYAIGFQKMQ